MSEHRLPEPDRPWVMRTYAGHSDARRSNELYRRNLAKGQTGLSVAFDLPTQTGYDPDHALARGEVGKVGVSIAHKGDMHTLFDGIPLDEMNTSMTINATAAWLLALYATVADENGVERLARRPGRDQDVVAREVELVHGRMHGWIDLLAFDARTGTVVIVEIKTRLDDLGVIERQLGWYERRAFEVARDLGWHPRRLTAWLLLLASDDVDAAIRANREALGTAFAMRAPEMLASLEGRSARVGRGLALIDPTSRRQGWLIRARVDGRRSAAPFRDYANAAARFTSGSGPRPAADPPPRGSSSLRRSCR